MEATEGEHDDAPQLEQDPQVGGSGELHGR